jgi:hypothetical protein
MIRTALFCLAGLLGRLCARRAAASGKHTCKFGDITAALVVYKQRVAFCHGVQEAILHVGRLRQLVHIRRRGVRVLDVGEAAECCLCCCKHCRVYLS